MLLFLVLVIVVALIGGLWPAVVAAVAASLVVNWFFTEPVHTFTIAEGQNLIALVTFLLVAGIVATLVNKLSTRSADSAHARAEAEALARVAGGLVGDDDAVDEMVTHLRTTFELDAVSLLTPVPEGGWKVEAFAGAPAPATPTGHRNVALVGGRRAGLRGAGAHRRRRAGAAGVRRPARLRPGAPPAPGRGGRGRRRWPRPTSCERPSSAPCPTTCAPRWPRSRRRPPACCRTTWSGRPRPVRCSWPPSTRRPTGSTSWSATCST